MLQIARDRGSDSPAHIRKCYTILCHVVLLRWWAYTSGNVPVRCKYSIIIIALKLVLLIITITRVRPTLHRSSWALITKPCSNAPVYAFISSARGISTIVEHFYVFLPIAMSSEVRGKSSDVAIRFGIMISLSYGYFGDRRVTNILSYIHCTGSATSKLQNSDIIATWATPIC